MFGRAARGLASWAKAGETQQATSMVRVSFWEVVLMMGLLVAEVQLWQRLPAYLSPGAFANRAARIRRLAVAASHLDFSAVPQEPVLGRPPHGIPNAPNPNPNDLAVFQCRVPGDRQPPGMGRSSWRSGRRRGVECFFVSGRVENCLQASSRVPMRQPDVALISPPEGQAAAVG